MVFVIFEEDLRDQNPRLVDFWEVREKLKGLQIENSNHSLLVPDGEDDPIFRNAHGANYPVLWFRFNTFLGCWEIFVDQDSSSWHANDQNLLI